MSIDSPDYQSVAEESAYWLAETRLVNGLRYNRFRLSVPADDENADRPEATAEERVTATVLYYPAHGNNDGAFVHRVGAHVGDETIHDVIKAVDSENVLRNFVQQSDMARVVDFARQDSRTGIPLVERRNSVLRQHQAPLAAVAIGLYGLNYQVTFSTAEIAWPWVALAEMEQFLAEN